MKATRESIIEEMQKLYSNPCIELSPVHLKYAEERHKQLSEQLKEIDAELDQENIIVEEYLYWDELESE